VIPPKLTEGLKMLLIKLADGLCRFTWITRYFQSPTQLRTRVFRIPFHRI
jgi:hypothetical protein